MELAGHVAPEPLPQLTATDADLLRDLSDAEREQVAAFARFIRRSKTAAADALQTDAIKQKNVRKGGSDK
jgi:hypothetical protein